MNGRAMRTVEEVAKKLIDNLHSRPVAQTDGEYDLLKDIEQMETIARKHIYKRDLEIREECAKVVEGKRYKHELDNETYLDTSGGRMCAVCGKPDYDLNEPCEDSPNRFITDVARAIRSLEIK